MGRSRLTQAAIGGLLWLAILGVVIYAVRVPLVSTKIVDAEFLDKYQQHKALVFFGYSQCADLCPMTMMTLREFYLSGTEEQTLPLVMFVEIDNHSDSAKAALYVKNFHKNFHIYFPKDGALEVLADQFGLNIRQLGESINHRGYLYSLVKQREGWKVQKAYSPQVLSAEFLRAEFL